jgi:hypothetical protein
MPLEISLFPIQKPDQLYSRNISHESILLTDTNTADSTLSSTKSRSPSLQPTSNETPRFQSLCKKPFSPQVDPRFTFSNYQIPLAMIIGRQWLGWGIPGSDPCLIRSVDWPGLCVGSLRRSKCAFFLCRGIFWDGRVWWDVEFEGMFML